MATANLGASEGEESPSRLFACPYYKFNPALCDECKKFQFPRISDMKQHLIRCHSLPEPSELSCTSCHRTFVNEQLRMNHGRKGKCQSLAAPEKLSPKEVELLKRTKFCRGFDGVRQWFAIWNQLFPGHAEPQSPYKELNNIKEALSFISPTVVTYLHASLPVILPLPTLQMIIDKACLDFCKSLPTSRRNSSAARLGLPMGGHEQTKDIDALNQTHPQDEMMLGTDIPVQGSLLAEHGLMVMASKNNSGSDAGLSAKIAYNNSQASDSHLLTDGSSSFMCPEYIEEVDISRLGQYVIDDGASDWMWKMG